MQEPGRERRRTRGARRRLSLAVVGLLAIFGVLALGAPAWAHEPVVSGQTVCSDSDHLVTWSIGNSETDKVMTITAASASDGTHSYAVTGYSKTVGPSGTTSATTTVPGGVTGSVTLTVTGTWPDGVTTTVQTSVALIESCSPTSTTSTTTGPETTSTTIASETSTLPPPESTTTITEAGNTTTTNDAPTTSTSIAVEGTTVLSPSTTVPAVAPSGSLPFTGGSFFGLVVIGLSFVAAGAFALIRRRRNLV